ncbi:MAG TPA: DUF4331 family protein, partial [Myxococcaceae bacterium]|nr:DUF4331 family protein [Myxococcaceae bacterium]
MKASHWTKLRAALLVVLLPLVAQPAFASDHADPAYVRAPVFMDGPEELERGITDLFVFPKGDQLIVVFAVRRALTTEPPYKLEKYTYAVHMDVHTQVTFDNEEDRNRYGGTLPNGDTISPDVTLEFRLNNDASLKDKSFKGLTNPDAVRLYTGVRDDPFIFPRFFGTNVVAAVWSIPMSSLPQGKQDFLVWGTSSRDGKLVDHVGRSLRTMMPRFDDLNTLEPSKHLAKLRQLHEEPGVMEDFFKVNISPLFALRHYDFKPDVMIYSSRFPAGYPNGRLLTDDVANLTCLQGDCLLFELSYGDVKQYPRATANDKPFSEEFPYLAEPWPARPPSPRTAF